VALQLLVGAEVIRPWLMRRFCGSRLLHHANFTLRGTLNATEVRIPVLGGLGMMAVPLWEQEPWLNRTIATLLAASSGAFVDVGVNLGQTLIKVKTLQPDRRYVGFEPNPTCVAFVRRLVALNRFQATTIAPFGLSDAARTVALFARNDDPADSSATVIPDLYTTQATWARTPVAVLPGDEALAMLDVGRIGVLKIDVEGAELEVIRGLEGTLQAHRPSVLCELLPSYATGQKRWAFRQPRVEAVVGTMRALGYRLFRLLPSGEALPLERIEPHSDNSLTNYAFVPPDVVSAFTRDTVTSAAAGSTLSAKQSAL
jgi:FkbM family methyltransferase